MSLHLEQLDLQKLLEQLLDEAWPSFEKNGLEAQFSCVEHGIPMEGDGNLLARLFENLLNNAVKYGKDGKIIRVAAKVVHEHVLVQVINYGYVIPKEESGKIISEVLPGGTVAFTEYGRNRSWAGYRSSDRSASWRRRTGEK